MVKQRNTRLDWARYLEMMRMQKMIHTAVQENNFEMQLQAWAYWIPYWIPEVPTSTSTRRARLSDATTFEQNKWIFFMLMPRT